MAVALVFLAGGGISFEQAAAMVIGMNLGTTLTAILASLGGSVAMRQTALANLFFNLGTALLAYPLLALMSPFLLYAAMNVGETTALVIFHTGFNLAGALLFLPFTSRFAMWIEKLVPDRAKDAVSGRLLPTLDPALLQDEGAAMDVAHSALGVVCRYVFNAAGKAFAPDPDMRSLATLDSVATPALNEIKDYISRINLPAGKLAERNRYAVLLHQADHLTRLIKRLERRSMIDVLLSDPALSRPARALGATLRIAANPDSRGLEAMRLAKLSDRIEARTKRHRRATLLREHIGMITVAEMFDRTDAMRWLHRVADHVSRIAYYNEQLPEAVVSPAPDKPEPVF
jgi:phosphate:Na+ symporter